MDEVGAQLAAYPPEQDVQRVGIGIVAAFENLLAEAVAADHAAAVVDEVAQHAELLRTQRQRLPIQLEAPSIDVQLQRAALQARAGMAMAAADQRPQAQHQFVGLEGLGEVVVGAGIEAGQFVVPAPAPGRPRSTIAACRSSTWPISSAWRPSATVCTT
ncbi:hypothetical protein G6F31_011287 [Rhizopus arrhizus]|nr:hypothetical protein G6F31_011287 [Rhizopus arrhizus]